jgi:hypothetical protein
MADATMLPPTQEISEAGLFSVGRRRSLVDDRFKWGQQSASTVAGWTPDEEDGAVTQE